MTTINRILDETFSAHGVKASFTTAFKGPSITLYAYQLAAGQSVRSVTAIATDLAVAVGQEAVRILTPIPGTSLIGVEVPNKTRVTVDYDPEMAYSMDPGLFIPIGVDVKSNVIEADLTKLPHLLVAGSTGSGKSVALNTIITALIDRNSPADLRLHLIDPKRVELAQFADAPQVENMVTDLDYVEALLDDLVDLMDTRYELFEDHGVRNIDEYNLLVEEENDAPTLPYHVIVVDEMADLMMQRKKTVEPLIVRIAQLARAAGIHLILATQRPTVDVITGLIKANVPSRLAFTVASAKDSMVILDQTGANALAGKGDALFLPIGQNRPVRVQGLWTSDDRIRVVVQAAWETYERPTQATSGTRAQDDEDGDWTDLGHMDDSGIRGNAGSLGIETAVLKDVQVDPEIITESWAFKEPANLADYIKVMDEEVARIAAVTDLEPKAPEWLLEKTDHLALGIATLAFATGLGGGFALVSALIRAIF